MRIILALAAVVAFALASADARGYHYSGGHHTSSHGGHYSGGSGWRCYTLQPHTQGVC